MDFKFYQTFKTEAECLSFLFHLQFGHLKLCPNPKCKQPMAGNYRPTRGKRCWSCVLCYHKLFPGAQTLLSASPLPLLTWFRAVWFVSCSRKGVTGHELARHLEVHHTTGHRMLMRILQNLDYNLPKKLSGHVECDETYISGVTPGHRGRNNSKQIVFCMIERNGDVIAKHVNDTKGDTLISLIKDHVHQSAHVYTDMFPGYKGLKSHGFKHHKINHSAGKYAIKSISTNCAENFFGRLKNHMANLSHVKFIQHYINLAQFQHRHRKAENQFLPMMQQLFQPINEE